MSTSAPEDMLHDPGFLVPLALTQAAFFLLLARAVDIYEPEPVGLLALMAFCGATVAPVLVLVVRPDVASLLGVDVLDSRHEAVFAAVVEEPCKGVSLLAVFFASRLLVSRIGVLPFDGPDNGFVYGIAVGLGYSFTENVFYLSSQTSLRSGFTVFGQRTDFLGTQGLSHAAYAAWIGIGLGLVNGEPRAARRPLYPLAGLGVAISLHAIHDLMTVSADPKLTALVDYVVLLGTFGAMIVFLRRQRREIDVSLQAEQSAGLRITATDLRLAVSWSEFAQRQVDAFRGRRGEDLQHLRRLRTTLVQLAMTRVRTDARSKVAGRDLHILRVDAAELLAQQRGREKESTATT